MRSLSIGLALAAASLSGLGAAAEQAARDTFNFGALMSPTERRQSRRNRRRWVRPERVAGSKLLRKARAGKLGIAAIR